MTTGDAKMSGATNADRRRRQLAGQEDSRVLLYWTVGDWTAKSRSMDFGAGADVTIAGGTAAAIAWCCDRFFSQVTSAEPCVPPRSGDSRGTARVRHGREVHRGAAGVVSLVLAASRSHTGRLRLYRWSLDRFRATGVRGSKSVRLLACSDGEPVSFWADVPDATRQASLWRQVSQLLARSVIQQQPGGKGSRGRGFHRNAAQPTSGHSPLGATLKSNPAVPLEDNIRPSSSKG